MNNGVKYVLTLIAGAAIGSTVTWKFVKTKYEKIAQEEIESVKKSFSKEEPIEETSTEQKTEGAKVATVITDPMREHYNSIVDGMGYLKKEGGSEVVKKPYVISPEEFGERTGYDTETLYCYADGILTDESDELIEDIDAVIGLESLTHFGEYEDDSVHVRNDELRTDYEILRDVRKYLEAKNDR